MMTSTVLGSLSQEHLDTLTSAGFSPADVVDWIKAHGYQGAALLRQLLPLFGFDPKVQAVISMILDLLYPPQSQTV